MAHDTRTIEQRLAEVGLMHKRTANSDNTRKHEIIRIADGVSLGEFEALESLGLIRLELARNKRQA